MWQSVRVIGNSNPFAKHKLRKFHCVIPTRDTRWPWVLCHGFLPHETCAIQSKQCQDVQTYYFQGGTLSTTCNYCSWSKRVWPSKQSQCGWTHPATQSAWWTRKRDLLQCRLPLIRSGLCAANAELDAQLWRGVPFNCYIDMYSAVGAWFSAKTWWETIDMCPEM